MPALPGLPIPVGLPGLPCLPIPTPFFTDYTTSIKNIIKLHNRYYNKIEIISAQNRYYNNIINFQVPSSKFQHNLSSTKQKLC
jgi:hypothetical protein